MFSPNSNKGRTNSDDKEENSIDQSSSSVSSSDEEDPVYEKLKEFAEGDVIVPPSLTALREMFFDLCQGAEKSEADKWVLLVRQ